MRRSSPAAPPRAFRARRRTLPGALAALAASALGAEAAGALPPPPRLARLEVSVVGKDSVEARARLQPRFDPEVFHYAVRCDDPQTLSVSGAAAGDAAALTLNGAPIPPAFADREIVLRRDQDLAVEVSVGGASATYAVHCVSREFPDIWTVSRGPRRADGLLLVDPIHANDDGEAVSHLAILDDRGVPRFHRRINGWARNFRWHAAHRKYSYSVDLPPDRTVRETVLLDEELRPVARPRPVGLTDADHHDFLLTEEGNYLFLVYEPTRRDLSRYPAPDGEYPYSTSQPTIDSVIQEVTPDGEVRFQWNSGEYEDGSGRPIETRDCLWLNGEYAALNSFFLVDGDLVASFRGCSQALRIERPSGRVVWQLGGSSPTIADGRRHWRIVGDPEQGFCGQHTAIENPRGVVTLFDNAVYCPGSPRRDPVVARRAGRIVEYRLEDGDAVFSRHYRALHDSTARGAVQLLDGGGWLITWGSGRGRPHTGAIELDGAGREVFALALRGARRAHLYRAYREYGLRVPLNLPGRRP